MVSLGVSSFTHSAFFFCRSAIVVSADFCPESAVSAADFHWSRSAADAREFACAMSAQVPAASATTASEPVTQS